MPDCNVAELAILIPNSRYYVVLLAAGAYVCARGGGDVARTETAFQHRLHFRALTGSQRLALA